MTPFNDTTVSPLSLVFRLVNKDCFWFLSSESNELCRLPGGVSGLGLFFAPGMAVAFLGLGFSVGLRTAGVKSVFAMGPFL